MPTSVHLPAPLLSALDRRAKHLGISRNRLIVRALERELAAADAWSPGFVERLRATTDDVASAADELLADVRARRTSKPARRL